MIRTVLITWIISSLPVSLLLGKVCRGTTGSPGLDVTRRAGVSVHLDTWVQLRGRGAGRRTDSSVLAHAK